MKDIMGIFINNLFGFDWIILLMAVGNFAVYMLTRADIDRIYSHFNAQDYIINLSDEAKAALHKTTKNEDARLTASELLSYREKMNKRYALYTNLTTMFPLMGMLGTVVSLIPMVNSIGAESAGLFFSALTSTFWGIVWALVFKLLDASISYKIDDNEKHMEYMLNPGRKSA
ncbi:MAG: MotA/TolQ/ExbB proton channel family protein [Clostridia bacterium]|nr:MotA/TolQ/ExbB proton channel family protein [Clostridia bacterium]MBQ4611485.1 MotA/TolQ/ExbB proton channel family protein [Clostridia bacterium]MBQ6703581.1 MotA/TolQ/ExbB proton channel family protein [Clostridia bacterium]